MTSPAPKPPSSHPSHLGSMGARPAQTASADLLAGVKVREWRPLRSYPAFPHPRQAEIDNLRNGLLEEAPLLFGRLAR